MYLYAKLIEHVKGIINYRVQGTFYIKNEHR